MNGLRIASLWSNICANADAEFLVQPDRRSTYGDLRNRVLRMLALFDECGAGAGSRILIVTNSEFVAISAFIAGLLDGVVPVMLSPRSPEFRVEAIRRSVEPALLFCDEERKGESWAVDARPVRPYIPVKRRLLGSRSAESESAAQQELTLPEAKRRPRLPDAPDDLAYILFTSGTTQEPAGVMITRRNILANLTTISRLFGYTPHSRIFNDMILAHGDGLVQGPLLAITTGCALIRQGGYTLAGQEAWLNAVRTNRATHVITVPTVWSMIDRYAAHDDYFDSPECTALFSVAARLDTALWARLEARFGRPVFNQYGLTETVTSALYAGSGAEMGAVGTIGKPVDCLARISPRGDKSPDDGSPQGELQLRGDNVFPGYWKSSDRTATSFTTDGWLRTGDLVERRSDGSFQFLARLKAVIMSGGFLIRPEEIEEALLSHPAVSQVVSVGMPDPEFEEVPMAAVILDTPTDEAELVAHCRARLEPLKVPKRIVAVSAIPRGDAGKARLGEVRSLIASATAASRAAVPESLVGKVEHAVLGLAAQVFRVDLDTLAPSMAQGDIAGWDSFSHINLIMAAETRFGVAIPASKVAAIRTLGDIVRAIEES